VIERLVVVPPTNVESDHADRGGLVADAEQANLLNPVLPKRLRNTPASRFTLSLTANEESRQRTIPP